MTGASSILIVEDDREIGLLVRDLLEREGFAAALVRSGAELDGWVAKHGLPQLVVLDLMLPGEAGLSIFRRLRGSTDVPVLMLTAKRDDIDRIIGLEMGADDYLGKPFNSRELLARIRTILRRAACRGGEPGGAAVYAFAEFTFDSGARTLKREDGAEVPLMTVEFELLQALLEQPQKVLSRDQLMDRTKGRAWGAFDRSIDLAVSRLRRKIEPRPEQPSLIKTVRNGGYLLAVPVRRVPVP
jgi:two-component system, OmpR family, response regulator